MNEPIHIISLGAGVQSSTMSLMAAHGEITPMPKCAIFADTGDEPKAVYMWLKWLEKELPFPVQRVSKGHLSKALLTVHTKKDGSGTYIAHGIPAFTRHNTNATLGIIPRQCTQNFKVIPLDRAARKIGAVKRGQKVVAVVMWMGISLDEVHRMKSPRHLWQSFRYPLVDSRMRRSDCLRWMERKGYPQPPRSACIYCPYHSDAEWRNLRDNSPEEFKAAVQFDYDYRAAKAKFAHNKSTPFLHNSRVPLDQVDFSTDEDHGQQVMFGNECEGMCGV